MDVHGRAIALYGRFSPGMRDRLTRDSTMLGATVARDLTRRSDILVIGALAAALIDGGAVRTRLAAARERGLVTLGERAFAAALAGSRPETSATLPLAAALGGGLTPEDAEVLAAFDLIELSDGKIRFADGATVKTAAELTAAGRPLAEVVGILGRARDRSPRGRHKIVLTPTGEAALAWPDGLSTLEGQGMLAFDEANAGLDELFEAATLAEAAGDADEAARLYDLCARADRKDPIAPYNHGNILLGEGDFSGAAFAYQRALARDPEFAEARYNLAQALEALGKPEAAAGELEHLLASDTPQPDAVFNLAQLRMKAGDLGVAKGLFERYLASDPPSDWAQTARRAIQYCAAGLSG